MNPSLAVYRESAPDPQERRPRGPGPGLTPRSPGGPNAAGMLERRIATSGVVYLASPLLEKQGLPHAFGTRRGGVSPPPHDTLHLGSPSPDAPPQAHRQAQENRRRLLEAAGCPGRALHLVWQVHGAEVVQAEGEPAGSLRKADALVTCDPSCAVAVRTADCFPVLLAVSDGRAVAAVHAGWRGVIAGVVPAAAAALLRISGASPGELLAAIGPGIGPDAFQVGEDVAALFARRFGADAPVRRNTPEGTVQVDLAEAIARQLRECGVPGTRVDRTDRCAHRDREEFFSHRRDSGATGRMGSVIAPRSRAR